MPSYIFVLGTLDLEAQPLEAVPSYFVPSGQPLTLHWTIQATGPGLGGNLTFPAAAANPGYLVLCGTTNVTDDAQACSVAAGFVVCPLPTAVWSSSNVTHVWLWYMPRSPRC